MDVHIHGDIISLPYLMYKKSVLTCSEEGSIRLIG